MTDCWQPIDVGSIGQLIKNIFRMDQAYWVDLTHTRDDGAEEPSWAMGGCLAALPTSKPYVKGHGHLDTNFTEPFSDTTYFDQNFTGSPNFVCADFVPEPMDGGEEKDEEEDDTSDSADSGSSSTATD